MKKRLTGLCALILACAWGCDASVGDADGGADASMEAAGPVAVLAVPESGAVGFEDAPYPNEVFVGDDGTLDLGTLPGRGAAWDGVRDVLDRRTGFCRTCPIHFPFLGALDPASLPADARGAGAASDPIVLMRVDGDGGFIPLEVDAFEGSLNIRPAGLRVLEANTAYVAALTDSLAGPGGRPLAPSDAFLAIRDGSDTTSRASASIGAALDALVGAGVARDRVVSVATFTTTDPAAFLRELAAVVSAAPAPVATVTRVFRRTDGTLDALFGTTDETGYGFRAPAAGTDGETAIHHADVEMVILGTFESPRIVTGTGTDIGLLRRGADGALEAGPAEAVPFALGIPVGADLTDLPVSIAAAGLPGTRDFAIGTAQPMNAMGVAAIGIDPFQSGARALTATDARSFLRGLDAADGIEEHDNVDVVTRVQGGSGNGDVAFFHPGLVLGATAQMVTDLAMLIRLLQEGDLSNIASEDAALTGFAFDPDAHFFTGVSYGAATGASALAIQPGIHAAALHVGFGSAGLVACQAPDNRPTFHTLATSVYEARGSFDEVERRMCLDPNFGFLNRVFDVLNPAPVLHVLLDAPLTDQPPPHLLLQQASHDETVGRAAGESLLLAAGIPLGGDDDFEFSELTIDGASFSENRTTPNGTITAAGWMYGGADHNLSSSPQQNLNFEAPLRAPFVPREPPGTIDNPIDEVWAQIQAFYQSHLDGGPVTISAP